MDAAFPPPEQLGKYRFCRELGRGSMGSVFLYRRAELFEQLVAVKFLHVAALTGVAPERLLLSLDHPNIVRVLDVLPTSSGASALVMEFVDGPDLSLYCTREQLSERRRLELLLAVVEAVAFAHSRLLTHGDLKPANILVNSSGEPQLVDFGLAGWYPAHGPAGPTYFSPGFSSPEQRLGVAGTVAGDVFALGRTIEAVLAGDAEPLSRHLRAIVQHACAPEAEERYGSAAALAADLRAVLEHRPVLAYRQDCLEVARRWSGRNPALASLLVALLVAMVCAVSIITVETSRAIAERRTAEARLRELVVLTGALQRELYDTLPATKPAEAARTALLDRIDGTMRQLQAETKAAPVRDAALARELQAQQQSLARLRAAASAEARR